MTRRDPAGPAPPGTPRPRRDAGRRPTSSDSRPRRRAPRPPRARVRRPRGGRPAPGSSTFMLTCTTPRLGSAKPSARTPGKAAARLAHDGRDLARNLEVVRFQQHVERDQRTPRADEHGARGRVEPSRPEVRRELAGVQPPLQLLRPSAPEERGAATLAVQEHGQPEFLPDAPRQLERRRRARSMSSGRTPTIGTTSAAPTRGCAPSCRRRSIRSRAHAIPATSAATSSVRPARRA